MIFNFKDPSDLFVLLAEAKNDFEDSYKKFYKSLKERCEDKKNKVSLEKSLKIGFKEIEKSKGIYNIFLNQIDDKKLYWKYVNDLEEMGSFFSQN